MGPRDQAKSRRDLGRSVTGHLFPGQLWGRPSPSALLGPLAVEAGGLRRGVRDAVYCPIIVQVVKIEGLEQLKTVQ